MSDFCFLTLGVGNAFSERYYSSCLALQAEKQWLLIDCPHPIRKMLYEGSANAGVRLGIEDLSATVLTHLHADHSSGLEMLGFYCRYAMTGHKAKLLAHPDVSDRIWTGLLSGSMEWSIPAAGQAPVQRTLTDFFELISLNETQSVQIGPFTIECRKTIHSIPTTALRIRAAGRTLGLSADTAYDQNLIDWLSEADLVVHETGEAGLHTPFAKLTALAAPVRHKMRLIHYADDFDVEKSEIEALRQGRIYDV